MWLLLLSRAVPEHQIYTKKYYSFIVRFEKRCEIECRPFWYVIFCRSLEAEQTDKHKIFDKTTKAKKNINECDEQKGKERVGEGDVEGEGAR